MRRYLILLSVGLLCSIQLFSQVKKHFSIDNGDFKKVSLSFSLSSGTCYISPKDTPQPLNVYSNLDINNFEHKFVKEISNGIYYVNLDLREKGSDDYSQSISYKLFKKSEATDDQIWKLFLSKQTSYDLNLEFGIGDSFVDLSGLALERLNIQTGSANVKVGFLSGGENRVEMDTFKVKVDLGTLEVRRVGRSNARYVFANVGFGDLFLDFSEGTESRCDVKASVGAGDLVIAVPTDHTPVLIKVRSSMLCQVKLASSFKEIEDDIYVNEYYKADAKNLLTFKVDGSMGNIIFKEK
jgi:hypothetical protein